MFEAGYMFQNIIFAISNFKGVLIAYNQFLHLNITQSFPTFKPSTFVVEDVIWCYLIGIIGVS